MEESHYAVGGGIVSAPLNDQPREWWPPSPPSGPGMQRKLQPLRYPAAPGLPALQETL